MLVEPPGVRRVALGQRKPADGTNDGKSIFAATDIEVQDSENLVDRGRNLNQNLGTYLMEEVEDVFCYSASAGFHRWRRIFLLRPGQVASSVVPLKGKNYGRPGRVRWSPEERLESGRRQR